MAYTPYPFEKTTCVQVADEFIIAGKVWRIGRYFSAIPASGYATIAFHTPINKITLYQLKEVNKTGGEFLYSLVEGGSYAGGTSYGTPYNLRRQNKNDTVLLTSIQYGISPTATVTGGVESPPRGLPGESQGSQKTAGGLGGDFFELLPNTDYILKLTNLATVAGNGNILIDLAVGI